MRQLLQRPMYSGRSERLSVRRRFKRQPHIKLCAIRSRAEVDFSVMTFDDDSVADDQAKSRAGSALGCEEGHRKDVGLDLCRDSAAIVSDLDEKKLARSEERRVGKECR